jgi:hypothetical protein
LVMAAAGEDRGCSCWAVAAADSLCTDAVTLERQWG